MTATRRSICFIMPKAYPLFNRQCQEYFGGAEVDLYMIATELARDPRFDVSFIVADYGQPESETSENVRLIRSLNFTAGPIRQARALWRAMKKADAQIYFLKTPSPGLVLADWFCRRHKRCLAYRTASSEEADGTYARKHPFLAKFIFSALRRARWIFSQNETDAMYLRQTYRLLAQPIKNGHRLMEQTAAARDTILWVGRSAAVKNPHIFLQLAQRFPDDSFTMICRRATGDDNYQRLEAQAKQIANVKLLSDVPFEQIQKWFQRALLFVNTSASEGFPNTFIQACLAGVPILSFNVNPDDFLDKYRCGCCAQNDWPTFCRQFEQLLEPQSRETCSRHAYHYVAEHHDIAKLIEKYKAALGESL